MHGDPGSGVGRIGIKAIAKHLNINNIRWRGRIFSTSFVEDVLKNEAYVGNYFYNRMDSRTRKPRPRSEWTAISVPAIVDRELFDAAQRLKIEQRPNKQAPRLVNGPTLLAGLAVCETCGEGMMLRTGKGGGIATSPAPSPRPRASAAVTLCEWKKSTLVATGEIQMLWWTLAAVMAGVVIG